MSFRFSNQNFSLETNASWANRLPAFAEAKRSMWWKKKTRELRGKEKERRGENELQKKFSCIQNSGCPIIVERSDGCRNTQKNCPSSQHKKYPTQLQKIFSSGHPSERKWTVHNLQLTPDVTITNKWSTDDHHLEKIKSMFNHQQIILTGNWNETSNPLTIASWHLVTSN